MKTSLRSLVWAGLLTLASFTLGSDTAQAQFGLSVASPGFGLSVGGGVPYGAYPAYPIVAPPPVIVPRPIYYPPPVYGRPYYGGAYGRPYYGGYPGYGPRGYYRR